MPSLLASFKKFFKDRRKESYPKPDAIQAAAMNVLPPRKQWRGLTIEIENWAGSKRFGPGWSTYMLSDYGFIVNTKGADGEGIDVYLGKHLHAPYVYIVHQNDPKTGKYDEDKVMIGYLSFEGARQGYRQQYDDENYLGDITRMEAGLFASQVRNGTAGLSFRYKKDPEKYVNATLVKGEHFDADWKEHEHPRGGDPEHPGRFTKKPGTSGKKANKSSHKIAQTIEGKAADTARKKWMLKAAAIKELRKSRPGDKKLFWQLQKVNQKLYDLRQEPSYTVRRKGSGEDVELKRFTVKEDPAGSIRTRSNGEKLVKLDWDNPPEFLIDALFNKKVQAITEMMHNIYVPLDIEKSDNIFFYSKAYGGDIKDKPGAGSVSKPGVSTANTKMKWNITAKLSRSSAFKAITNKIKKDLTHKNKAIRNTALLVGIAQATGIRGGSSNGEDGTVGLTSLQKEHFTISDGYIDVFFEKAKSGMTNKRRIYPAGDPNSPTNTVDTFIADTLPEIRKKLSAEKELTPPQKKSANEAWDAVQKMCMDNSVEMDKDVYDALIKQVESGSNEGPLIEQKIGGKFKDILDYSKEMGVSILGLPGETGKSIPTLTSHNYRNKIGNDTFKRITEVYYAKNELPETVADFMFDMYGTAGPLTQNKKTGQIPAKPKLAKSIKSITSEGSKKYYATWSGKVHDDDWNDLSRADKIKYATKGQKEMRHTGIANFGSQMLNNQPAAYLQSYVDTSLIGSLMKMAGIKVISHDVGKSLSGPNLRAALAKEE